MPPHRQWLSLLLGVFTLSCQDFSQSQEERLSAECAFPKLGESGWIDMRAASATWPNERESSAANPDHICQTSGRTLNQKRIELSRAQVSTLSLSFWFAHPDRDPRLEVLHLDGISLSIGEVLELYLEGSEEGPIIFPVSNTWNHVGITLDPNEIVLFWNGTEAARRPSSARPTQLESIEFNPHLESMSLWIDEIAVWDTLLPSQDFKNIYDRQRPKGHSDYFGSSFNRLRNPKPRREPFSFSNNFVIDSGWHDPATWVENALRQNWTGAGSFFTSIGSGDSEARAIVFQNDGKFILGGNAQSGPHNHASFALARYHPDGTLDISFGTNGTRLDLLSWGFNDLLSMAIQTDGKVVAAGRAWNNWPQQYDLAITRYTTSGDLDTTFSDDGIILFDIANTNQFLRGVGLDTTGRIVVGGYSRHSGTYDGLVARYLTNGLADTSFHTDGIVTFDLGAGDDVVYGLKMDTAGRWVTVGSAVMGADKDMFAVRITSTGLLDTAFHTDGKTLADPSGGNDDVAYAVDFSSSGLIVSTGRMANGTNNDVALVTWDNQSGEVSSQVEFAFTTAWDTGRAVILEANQTKTIIGRNWNGSNWDFAVAKAGGSVFDLDPSFGTDGSRVFALSSTLGEQLYGMSLDTTQRIHVAGMVHNGTNWDFAVARLLTTGAMDNAFQTDGIAISNFAANLNDIPHALAIWASNSRAVVVGSTEMTGTDYAAAVVRFTTAGALDNTFQTDGRAILNQSSGQDVFNDVVIETAGKTLAVGSTFGTSANWLLARFNTNGALDVNFQTDGIAIFDAPGGTTNELNAVDYDTAARILVAGSIQSGTLTRMAIARYLTTGALDTTFHTDGVAVASVAASGNYAAVDIMDDNSGRIVVGASALDTVGAQFMIARFTSTGVLDTTFHTDGIQLIDADPESGAELHAIAVRSDRKIVALGRNFEERQSIVIARLKSDGSLENTFGTAGVVQTAVNTAGDDVAYGLMLDNSQRILVAGSHLNDSFVSRFTLGEGLDTTFGSGGVRTHALGAGDDSAYGVATFNETRIVVGSSVSGTNTHFAAARLNPNGTRAPAGSPDGNFHTDGIAITDPTASTDQANALALATDGKILISGFSGGTARFATLRYTRSGDLDTSFGTNGMITSPFAGDVANARSLNIQPDGKIFVAGFRENGNANTRDFAVARYTTAGGLDTTFGTNGVNTFNSATQDEAWASALESNGSIIVVGRNGTPDFWIARLTTAGALSTSATFNFGGTDIAYGVTIATDGDILVTGNASNDLGVVRLTPGFAVDTAFHTDGRVTLNIATEEGRSIYEQPDGKILVGGYTSGGSNNFLLARFLSTGVLDTTFDTDGIQANSVSATGSDISYCLHYTSNHKIVLTGLAATDMAVVRYLSNGQLDTSFDTDGRVILNLGSTEIAYGCDARSEELIYLGGITNSNFVVERIWP